MRKLSGNNDSLYNTVPWSNKFQYISGSLFGPGFWWLVVWFVLWLISLGHHHHWINIHIFCLEKNQKKLKSSGIDCNESSFIFFLEIFNESSFIMCPQNIQENLKSSGIDWNESSLIFLPQNIQEGVPSPKFSTTLPEPYRSRKAYNTQSTRHKLV